MLPQVSLELTLRALSALRSVAGGAGWAFFDPSVTLAPNGTVGGRAPAIATQRASLADFLSQVEGRYVGFGDLVRVVHANTALWQRTALACAGMGSFPPTPIAPTQPPRVTIERRPASARAANTVVGQAATPTYVSPPSP